DSVNDAVMMKGCVQCGEAFPVINPLGYVVGSFCVCDAVAWRQYRSGLSWPSVSLVMRTYHNIELGPKAWSERCARYYGYMGGEGITGGVKTASPKAELAGLAR
ncbi:MAG TPA: hypothetical protein VK631_05790, partial [Solirubrobacteraceae bacterium]|nr:hypothetical protein [Solirubrobacteraceae bacterium]